MRLHCVCWSRWDERAGGMRGEWKILFTRGKSPFAFRFCTLLLKLVLSFYHAVDSKSANISMVFKCIHGYILLILCPIFIDNN